MQIKITLLAQNARMWSISTLGGPANTIGWAQIGFKKRKRIGGEEKKRKKTRTCLQASLLTLWPAVVG